MQIFHIFVKGLALLSVMFFLSACGGAKSSFPKEWKPFLDGSIKLNDTQGIRDHLYKVDYEKYSSIYNALKMKNYDFALKEISRIRLQKPKVSKLYTLEGYVYFVRKEYKKAVSLFTRAIELDIRKHTGENHFHRALGLEYLGHFEESLKDMTKALNGKWTKDSVRRFYNAIGDTSSTSNYIHSLMLINRAYSYSMLRQFDLAIEDLSKAIGLNEQKTIHMAYTRRGGCYFEKGSYDMAYDNIMKSLSLKKDYSYSAPDFNLLGVIEIKRGNHQEAYEAFKKAVDIDPDEVYIKNQAFALWLLGRKTEATSKMLDISQKSKNYHTFYHLGYFMHKQGKYNEAQRYYEKAATLNQSLLSNMKFFLDRVPVMSSSRKVYQEEYDLAKKYLTQEMKKVVKNVQKPSLILKSLKISPNPVQTGNSFDIKFRYSLQGVDKNSAEVKYYFKISKNKKELFRSSKKMSKISIGAEKLVKIPMSPVKVKGDYKITVVSEYKSLVKSKSVTLKVR